MIDPRTVTIWLDEHLPTDRTVAIDSGLFMGFPAAYLNAPDPRGFLFAQGFMSVGLGLASGIGGTIARPERLTIVAVGDGGALMSLPEFETAARLRLPILILIYNDRAYGAEVFDFPSHYHDGLVRFQSTDFADIGRALGMHGVTIRSTGDLTAVDKWLEARDGPLVVDTKVNPAVTSDVWAH